jgi:putative DNA primase/helicase
MATLPNLYHILLNHPEWKGVIAYDLFSGTVVKRKAPPFSAGAEPGEWTDLDDGRLALWLAQQFGLEPKDSMLLRALMNVADANRFHPVREYLAGLSWDGQARLDEWLQTFLGAVPRWYVLRPGAGGRAVAQFLTDKRDEVKKLAGEIDGQVVEYTAAVGAKFLIGAVARAMRLDVKMDNVLIMEGVQYLGKSSALKVLGEPWFTDQQIRIGDKDTYEVMRGQWIVELPELDALSKSESSSAKAFFSRSVDRYRSPYGRRAHKVPRQCVFAGTVNHYQYFHDASGNRRYWPVRCIRSDLGDLAAMKDQLWAEAKARFEQGEKWWVQADEKPMFDSEAEARYIGDAWENMIRSWLEEKVPGSPDGRRNECTMDQVLKLALKLDEGKWSRPEQTRVGQLMERIGWGSRGRPVGEDGARIRVYRRPGWAPAPASGANEGEKAGVPSNLSNPVQPRPTSENEEKA